MVSAPPTHIEPPNAETCILRNGRPRITADGGTAVELSKEQVELAWADMYKFLLRKGFPIDVAQDATQDATIILLLKYKPELGRPQAFSRTVVYRRALTIVRRRSTKITVLPLDDVDLAEEEAASWPPDPGSPILTPTETEEIDAAVEVGLCTIGKDNNLGELARVALERRLAGATAVAISKVMYEVMGSKNAKAAQQTVGRLLKNLMRILGRLGWPSGRPGTTRGRLILQVPDADGRVKMELRRREEACDLSLVVRLHGAGLKLVAVFDRDSNETGRVAPVRDLDRGVLAGWLVSVWSPPGVMILGWGFAVPAGHDVLVTLPPRRGQVIAAAAPGERAP
jgi:DNA-directed RNA polymerase specialized sigma24 family protein